MIWIYIINFYEVSGTENHLNAKDEIKTMSKKASNSLELLCPQLTLTKIDIDIKDSMENISIVLEV